MYEVPFWNEMQILRSYFESESCHGKTTPMSLSEVFVGIDHWLSYQVSVVLLAKKLVLYQEIFETKKTGWNEKELEINQSLS